MRLACWREEEKLWYNASQKSRNLADKLSRFAYRELIQTIETKCVEYNVLLVYVNPRSTSKTCPRCSAELKY